ncbi:MAG: hypothetical protein Fur0018_22790 [Anaerolineales bacterium]
MKIAFVTEDGVRISNHFGRAPYYRVLTLSDGHVTADEPREKAHHGAQGGGHTHNHGDMFAPIADCQVMVAGGMGTPAYAAAQRAGLEVILVGGDIQPALQAYLEGRLESDPRRVHQPMHRH